MILFGKYKIESWRSWQLGGSSSLAIKAPQPSCSFIDAINPLH
jgi:hypothetical protein